MMRLSHPCVVRLLGVSRGDPVLMVQELVPLGSMLDFLVQTPHLASPQHELRLWAAQIACGEFIGWQHAPYTGFPYTINKTRC